MSYMTVLYDVGEGVATITLNRPEAMNSMTHGLKAELLKVLQEARRDDSVRSVLITGAGRAFSAGQDLREHLENLQSGRGMDDVVRRFYNPIVEALTDMEKPVVAAVNGVAAGAGASLAFACDLRVAAEGASFLMAFARVGLAPDTGVSWTLQRLIGAGRAMELMLLAEPVDARRALELGLVHRVVPDALENARELALRLAQGPTTSYGAIKRAIGFASAHPLRQALELEAELQDRCGATEDHLNATLAFVNKEKPVFTGR
ncbi:enoyl-CoA hydratase-related protein [Rhizohabitans arisaemae]|uniref:enoyl-CoA hydratase-related protein n=1 Tax=Rhizohabitans arisaemae TaxID=2720610 RepID=UPI0024B25D60|nr:enoyl-CoA hydratase-related protein [Rhizohabitans arisaemae]